MEFRKICLFSHEGALKPPFKIIFKQLNVKKKKMHGVFRRPSAEKL